MGDWDPELYNRFRRYRAEPVEAILRRLDLSDRERIADLGCGSGENTIELARRTQDGSALGIDSSPAMIDRANQLRATLDPALAARIRFELGDIPGLGGLGEFTLIFSNAALHWLKNHRGILRACFDALAPGGKLVIQMPANDEETAKVTLGKLAQEEPWREKLGGVQTSALPSVAAPDVYRRILSEIGFRDIDCYYQTFAHPMNRPADVVEWYKSTGLRPYVAALEPPEQATFLAVLTERLNRAYTTDGAMTFYFRRLFLWARR
jgi:trans-aconitate 2-methyltransferase